MVDVHGEHGLESDHLVVRIAEGVDVGGECSVSAKSYQDVLHWVDSFAESRTVHFSNLVYQRCHSERPIVLVVTITHGFCHGFDEELGGHNIRGALTK